MTLDIIVPHYKEPWSRCQYLFDSIAMQRGVPHDQIGIILVNDGSDVVIEHDILARYPFRIEYLVKEHEGVSAARNAGLAHSKADYVMFCDADDGFLSNYGLYLVYSAMYEGFDFLTSSFCEETLTEKENALVLVGHTEDLTFMHGKVYLRQWLMDNNLWFDPDLTLHEDGYFNMLCHVACDNGGKSKEIKTPFYLWCWNGESTVRKDKEDFVLRTYEDVMLVRIRLCEQLKERGYDKEYRFSVITTVMNSYYDFQKTTYHLAKNQKYLKVAERAFKKFWTQFGKTFNDATNLQISEIAAVSRANAVKNGMLMEQQSLRDFLRHIDCEVK